MSDTTQSPLLIYFEETPNPETLKFVTNRMLHAGTADFKSPDEAESWSALSSALFQLPYVKGVYISQNFIAISKEMNYSWEDVKFRLKEQIIEQIEAGTEIVAQGYTDEMLRREAEQVSADYSEQDAEIVAKIKNLLDTYVKPAVETDGGNIEFKSWKDGIVTVVMQGACSGCPSSTLTLKSGIEGMMKRMIPEVQEVVSEAG